MRFVSKLDFKTKVELAEMMRKSPSFKVRQRAHAILLSEKKYKIDDLSTIFEVDRDTISNWLSRWESKGFDGLLDSPRPGRPRTSKTAHEESDASQE